MHNPIKLKNISLFFPQRECFSGFSTQINPCDRIAIIGKNGTGKSSLLKIIQGKLKPNEGTISTPDDTVFGSVPQVITLHDNLSGGQKFNQALTEALAQQPNILCLDEPTNHLDAHNRRSLMRLLKQYQGTLIMVTHDPELIRICNQIWHINNTHINIFYGNYDDYINQQQRDQLAQQKKLEGLKKELKKGRTAIEKERKRAAQSKKSNKYERDKSLRGKMRDTGSQTAGKKSGKLLQKNQNIVDSLQDLYIPKTINPTFNLDATTLRSNKLIVDIKDGSCGYPKKTVLSDISVQLGPTERIIIKGKNGSGKSTLIKAIAQQPNAIRRRYWHTPKASEIGYLDQHNNNLNMQSTALEVIQNAAPHMSSPEIRKHLNDFLFQTNEQVNAQVGALSGGEKTRLSLAQIAAQNPTLLILDEVTNSLDLETREHVIQVVEAYPGAMIIISHDEDFLNRINYDNVYEIKDGKLHLR